MKTASRRTAPGASREKLLHAAIDLFGMRGFDGVSTREIAARACVNIAGIAYQFGGKDQLYRACTEHIAEAVHSRLVAGALDASETPQPVTPEQAATSLKNIISRFARFFLAAPELDRFARIVVREQMDPTPAFEPLYRLVFEPMHARLCLLWAAATGGDPDSEDVKLKVFTIISQLMFFRIARTAALRRLGWQAIGPAELARIEAMVMESLEASLARHGQGGSS